MSYYQTKSKITEIEDSRSTIEPEQSQTAKQIPSNKTSTPTKFPDLNYSQKSSTLEGIVEFDNENEKSQVIYQIHFIHIFQWLKENVYNNKAKRLVDQRK